MATTLEENPLAAGLERLPVYPTTLVIFGGTGDLAHRKLLPAIYNLAYDGSLPDHFNLVAFARREHEHESFRRLARESIQRYSRRDPDPDVLDALLKRVRYVAGQFDDLDAYGRLAARLERCDADAPVVHNRIFYMATAPSFFPVIVNALGTTGLNRHEHAQVRLVVEKPFGSDLATAQELNRTVLSTFEEQQVFRIDHYLGKETVQNILAFRFANTMFEPIWNRNYIESVQITAAEDIGIGSRAGYYDTAGALRDLVQNHMLQLTALLGMEAPTSFNADSVRDEKSKVLKAIPPPTPDEVPQTTVRGQYTEGVFAGQPVPGYRQEDGVPSDSVTETYVALRLGVSNWRWAGVPFYLRTGKRLSRQLTEIALTLKPVPHLAFGEQDLFGVGANQLILTIQPNEGVSLSLGAKVPGLRMLIRPVSMEFQYGTSFLSQSPEAYERLVLDAMRGDATLFTRNDEVEASWRICDPILDAWSESHQAPAPYPAGSHGPQAADELLDPGSQWRQL